MKAGSFCGPQVCAALVDLFRELLDEDEWVVLDGPRTANDLGMAFVAVGWDPVAMHHVVAQRGDEDLCGRLTESGEIACHLAVLSGETEIAPLRDKAAATFAEIEEAIRASHNGLGGACDELSIGEVALTNHQGKDGAAVGITFTVNYVAYI